MINKEKTEPPSCLQFPRFMIGRDRHGNWVVQDRAAICGGLFVTRDAALRFVRSENGDRPPAVVMVPGPLELDVSRQPGPPQQQEILDAAKAA